MKRFLDILKGLKISNTIFLDSTEKVSIDKFILPPACPPTNKNLATALYIYIYIYTVYITHRNRHGFKIWGPKRQNY